MANEIYTSVSFTARKNGAEVAATSTFSVTMSGDEMVNATQVIGTSSELVTFGGIAGAPGILVIKNLDSTNFVEIGGDSGLTVFKIKILPGHCAVIQPTSSTLYAIADTSSVRIQVITTDV